MGFLREFVGSILFGITWIIVIICGLMFFWFLVTKAWVGCGIMAAVVAAVWGLSKGFRRLWPEKSSPGVNQSDV